MTTVILDSAQMDMILSTLMICTMCICFCIGWSCHEGVAK